MGWVRVAAPGGPVDVFNTHLHANYDPSTGGGHGTSAAAAVAGVPPPSADDFAAYRTAQVGEPF